MNHHRRRIRRDDYNNILDSDKVSQRPLSRRSTLRAAARSSPQSDNNDRDDDDDDDDDDDIDEEEPAIVEGLDYFLDNDEVDLNLLTRDSLLDMTVTQLKQQCRLRGKNVTGNKSQLIERLLERQRNTIRIEDDANDAADLRNNVDTTIRLQSGYTKYDKSIMTRRRKNSRNDDVNYDDDNDDDSNNNQQQQTANSIKKSKSTTVVDSEKVKNAKDKGADIVDVTDFIDVEELGKSFRTNDKESDNNVVETEEDSITNKEEDHDSTYSTEVWGEDARIVDDYEGRSIIVDGLSRTVIEYKGANNTMVQAYVVGSRISLRNFLRGGQQSSSSSSSSSSSRVGDSTDAPSSSSTTSSVVYSSTEEEVYAIQRKREMESKRGLIRPDEADGVDDTSDPDTGTYSTIERDYGDWGVYTPTGAQLSASEVQGVLLLSDVAGPFTQYTQTLADKIAFECQPVVVLVPDLFRGKPWTMINDTSSRNEDGLSYEEWRSMHPDRRVDVDIRAAASVLRERYAVSSLAIWGTCYGGGRALEAAAGYYVDGPNSYYTDVYSDRPPPPHVDPVAAVVWYPTRYNVTKLFGKDNEGFRTFTNGQERSVAVLAVFAEDDTLLGATPEDAMLLKDCLEDDPRIKDFMVKVFPDQIHGFAHLPESDDVVQDGVDLFDNDNFGSTESYNSIGGDAEVACLLSTAWVETYTRVFLPTVGTPVRYDDGERWSASTIEMQGYSANERRDVRAELDKALSSYNDVDIDLGRMSQSTSPMQDGPGVVQIEEIEESRERIRQQILDRYNISEDDDEETFERKFQQAKDDGALNDLFVDAYMDGDAYW